MLWGFHNFGILVLQESVQGIWISNDGSAIVTSVFGEKHLQVWNCDLNSSTVSKGPVISMKHPPVRLQCKNGWNGDDSLVILSVSNSGIGYLWNLKTTSADDFKPTRIMVKDIDHGRSTKKSHSSIIAARVDALESDGRVMTLVTYGSINSPEFNLLQVSNPGEDIVVAATDNIKRTVAEAGKENAVLAGKGVTAFCLFTDKWKPKFYVGVWQGLILAYKRQNLR